MLAALVLLVAAAFRLVALPDVPPGLAQDAVLDADIALFIRGGEHALFFHHGYGHEPLYHYWAAPFQAALGDNVLSARLPAAFLGLLLVALVLRWARWEYGAAAALVAGLGLAVSWWPIIFSRIGIRPILLPVLLVLAVWFWPLRARRWTWRGLVAAALAGLWLGLAHYSYTAGRVLLLIPLLMLAVLAVRYGLARRAAARDDAMMLRAQMGYAAVMLVVAALVYLPLALTLRANPDLQQRLEQLGGPLEALRAGDVGPVLEMTAATLGVFSFGGDPRWTYSLPGRPLFDPLTAILFYAGLALAVWRWRRPPYLLLLIWLLVALLPSALSPDAPSTVRLIGALPVVYLLPGLAVVAAQTRLTRDGRLSTTARRRLSVALGTLLGLLLILNGYRTVSDGFARWPQELETWLRYQATLGDIGRYWRATAGDAPPVVADGFFEPIDRDSLRRMIGADPAARWVQTAGGGAVVWPAGQTNPLLFVPEYAPLDPELAAVAGVVEPPLFRSEDKPSFAAYALSSAPAITLTLMASQFGAGPAMSLRGAAILNADAPVAEGLRLATWWEVGENLPPDVAIFVHLLDDRGGIVAQYDGLDVAAATLQAGDHLLQRHVIPLPPDVGPATVVIGLYTRGDGQRLATADGADTVELMRCAEQDGIYRCRLPEEQ